MDLRSVLGSFAAARLTPPHRRSESAPMPCAVCGFGGTGSRPVDLNVLNFERLKWGGVRHDSPVYAAFDLERFAELPPCGPGPVDRAALRELLDRIAAVPPDVTGATLQKELRGAFPSNKDERDGVAAILGHCGVLATPAKPGHFPNFVPHRDRAAPAGRVDMPYPAGWWTGTDGLNAEAVRFWFGHLLDD
ncbi:hypothetical protein CA12_01860 [Alienimonas californiensis]|uniref:Uncharacterized protein n=2 Tax=Alienimonas californiensis TaxID=2527989 RepID=A0A517P410_9PLAN|nr:hypothetical protein CA12_01860 [Alienimonas californiensis]